MTKNVTIGSRLRLLREQKGLSQTEVANLIGKTLKTYQRYERDETIPLVDTAFFLTKYYSVSIKYLVGETDNPKDYIP